MTTAAIISDIHGNLPALNAVLSYIRKQGITKEFTFCLGDIVGYGPQPNECVDLVREHCGTVLKGNHELEICGDGPLKNVALMWHKVFYWTRKTVTDDNKRYLASLPLQTQTRLFVAAHGKPGATIDEECAEQYALPYKDDGTISDVGARNMEEIRQYVATLNVQDPDTYLAVFGHIHKPYYFDDDIGLLFLSADVPERCFPRPGTTALLSVPAVGLPRDQSWRTGLAIVEDQRCWVLRLTYDANSMLDALVKNPTYPYNSSIRKALTNGLQWSADGDVIESQPPARK